VRVVMALMFFGFWSRPPIHHRAEPVKTFTFDLWECLVTDARTMYDSTVERWVDQIHSRLSKPREIACASK
jgi:hypothetical protein